MQSGLIGRCYTVEVVSTKDIEFLRIRGSNKVSPSKSKILLVSLREHCLEGIIVPSRSTTDKEMKNEIDCNLSDRSDNLSKE